MDRKKRDTFTEKITAYRNERGMTRRELGELLNVSEYTVKNWELGNTTPTMENLSDLADLFHVSIDFLTGRDAYETIDISDLQEHEKEILRMVVQKFRNHANELQL